MIKRNGLLRTLSLAVVGFGMSCVLLGCETSSHTTVRTFEYTNEPVKTQEPVDMSSGEYKMESPGKMVVDPSRQ